MYNTVESLYCTPETNIVLCINYTRILFFNILFIFERVQAGRDRERGGTEDLKWALCWEQQAWWGAQTHSEILTWADVKCSTNWATQMPLELIFLSEYIILMKTRQIYQFLIHWEYYNN